MADEKNDDTVDTTIADVKLAVKDKMTKQNMQEIEAEWEWVVAIEDGDFYLIHGLDKEDGVFGNIWNHNKQRFLLKKFLPNVNELEHITIFGDNKVGYHVFSHKNQEFLIFQDYRPKNFILLKNENGYDIIFTDGISKISILSKESKYSRLNHVHIANTKNEEIIKIAKDPNSNRVIILNDKLLYDIEQQNFINT